MADNDDNVQEILLQLKLLSNNIMVSESIHDDLGIFRSDTNDRIMEIKDTLKELKQDLKVTNQKQEDIDRTLIEFKNEMKPIIQFKEKVQQQIIRYSTLAFFALFTTTVGMNQLGLS